MIYSYVELEICNKVMLQISKLCITVEISSRWIADIVIVMHDINKLVSTNDISAHVSCWLMTVNHTDAA